MASSYLPPGAEYFSDSADDDTSTERGLSEDELDATLLDAAHKVMPSLGGPATCQPGNSTSSYHFTPTDVMKDGSKTRQRSGTAIRTPCTSSGSSSPTDFLDARPPADDEEFFDSKTSSSEDSDQAQLAQEDRVATPPRQPAQARSPSVESSLTSLTTSTIRKNGSGSSSGSGSTVRQATYGRKVKGKDKETDGWWDGGQHPVTGEKVDVMSFLDPDSPVWPDEIVHQARQKGSHWKPSRHSPSARSSSSSTSSSLHSDVFSEPAGGNDDDTDHSSSPDHSVLGDVLLSSDSANVASQHGTAEQTQRMYRAYGTPEMPRGNAHLPYLPPSALPPRVPAAYRNVQINHLPRADKLPLSGYGLLAAKLTASCASGPEGPVVKPIYRRFEALNHRLLLHMQDQLAEAEERLNQLDTLDTQRRTRPGIILPASRRDEAAYFGNGDIYCQRINVFGHIGHVLDRYSESSSKSPRRLLALTLC
jgi:hypothetical protein